MRREVRWLPTGMAATVPVDVAVVRADRSKRCETCGKRRVLYALSLTVALLGNPEHPYRCAPCWGLR